MTLRWPAHRTSQPKVPCTWGFLTNMLVMAPWPVFACLGFVSSVCPLWSLSVGLTVSGLLVSELCLGLGPVLCAQCFWNSDRQRRARGAWAGGAGRPVGRRLAHWSSRQSMR